MRTSNILSSSPFGGTANYKLRSVVEDPMHKKSQLSGPIQLCDINAYFIMQTIKIIYTHIYALLESRGPIMGLLSQSATI